MRDPVYGCERWNGPKDKDGYGRTKSGKSAHIVAWEEANDQPANGRKIDHLCRRRDCVNPAHLEAVDHRENCRRRSWRYRRKLKTCPKGHDLARYGRLTPEGGRVCRVCSGV